MLRLLSLAALVFAVLTLSAGAGENWPSFRGGSQPTVVEEITLPEVWDKKKNVLWSTEIPGGGWSSPVVWGNKVFVTSVVSDAKGPLPKKGLYIEDVNGKSAPGNHRWLVTCLDRTNGKKLWEREAFKGPGLPLHKKNSLASETPVVDAERVYAYFGNVGLACYDHEGKELWIKKSQVYKTRMNWGMAASPVAMDGKLYVVNDNENHSSLTSLDGRNGTQLWEVQRNEGSNWSTPFIWHNDQRTEIVTAGTRGIRSYGLDGKLLWELKGMSSISIPTPFSAAGLLFITSGYVQDKFRPLYAIRPGAIGDISLKDKEEANGWIAWSHRQAGPYHPTPIVYGDFLYVLLDRGFLTCYDVRTGKVVYEKERLGPGAFTASPWAYKGRFFCLSEDGDTIVVQAGKQFKVLGKNSLDEMSMATPALAGGSLFVRTQSKLYCLRQEEGQGGK